MFGRRLQILREQNEMTQEQLAKLVSLSQQTIGHYEKGRANPSMETVILLAQLFNVSTDYLLGLTDDKSTARKNIHFIGEKLTALRNAKGLSVLELSNVTGTNESVLLEVEAEQTTPDSDMVTKICEALKVKEVYFYKEESRLEPALGVNEEYTPYAVLTEKAYNNRVPTEELGSYIDYLIHRKK